MRRSSLALAEVLIPHGAHQIGQLPTELRIVDDCDPPRLAVASARSEAGVVEDGGQRPHIDGSSVKSRIDPVVRSASVRSIRTQF